jgi:hypothetical protein
MRDRLLSLVVLFVLASTVASYFHAESPVSPGISSINESGIALQTEKKPPQDYMQKRLSRDAKPLGLKENKALDTLLEQSHIKWVIRSEIKHILN